MFLKVLFIIIVLFFIMTLLKIGSNIMITKRNLVLIEDIIKNLDNSYKVKIIQIINWHKKYGYPIYTERSIKYLIKENLYQKNRFTIIIPLSYFIKDSLGNIDEEKWLEWSKILEIPKEIEKKCIDYIAVGRGDVDFIWGLDLNANSIKQKIYIEDEKKRTIESYIYSNKSILERYIYFRKSLENHSKFSFMYLRTNITNNLNNKVIDSYHVALKEPLEVKMDHTKYFIHLIAFKKGESYTFYYRS